MVMFYSDYAWYYFEAGVFPIPANPITKKPYINWGKLTRDDLTREKIIELVECYSNSGLALITGSVSNLTVLDCDDPDRTIEDLQNEFGVTPLIVKSPRGGHHLYYRSNGERTGSFSIRKLDIRGKGGIIMAPPSYNSEKEVGYKFVKGDYRSFKDLTFGNFESLQITKNNPKNHNDKIITEGGRNQYLFFCLKEQAQDISSYEGLLSEANRINGEKCSPALEFEEVCSIANSVWRYKNNGKLITSNNRGTFISDSEYNVLVINPKAMALYIFLKRHHKGVRDTFVICQKEVSKAMKWGGDGRPISKAIAYLVSSNLIKCLEKNRGQHLSNMYAFI